MESDAVIERAGENCRSEEEAKYRAYGSGLVLSDAVAEHDGVALLEREEVDVLVLDREDDELAEGTIGRRLICLMFEFFVSAKSIKRPVGSMDPPYGLRNEATFRAPSMYPDPRGIPTIVVTTPEDILMRRTQSLKLST